MDDHTALTVPDRNDVNETQASLRRQFRTSPFTRTTQLCGRVLGEPPIIQRCTGSLKLLREVTDMVNVKTPASRVDKRGLWPPKDSKEVTLRFDDNWWTVAKRERMDVWDLIDFNFKTRVPEEVNWYLRELLGCRVSFDNGKNYSFYNSTTRKIYAPISKGVIPPSLPTKKTVDQILRDIWIENGNGRDPRQHRIACMLSTFDQGADDRVILWSHIAPDEKTPVPVHLVRRRDSLFGASAIDPKWLYENIKTASDVDRQPTGNGLGFTRFVTSLRKFFEELQPNLSMLINLHDQIIETHRMLDNWANASDGGSSSMPREYKAIKDWVKKQEDNKRAVLNCVIVA